PAVGPNSADQWTYQRVQVQIPPPIVDQADTRQVRELTVQVFARAAPGRSVTKPAPICPGAASPNPCKVHFDGPVSWETNLVASASLSPQINTGTLDTPNQPVTLTNSTGVIDLTACRTQPCVALDINNVNLHVEAAAGASSSTVPLVDAPPSHGPPTGYRVTAITIAPVTIVISGDPVAVGRVLRITLPPVDLSTSTSDATFQVA